MSEHGVKARVKCLREAIHEMFGIPVSQAQAYELIAKEENFPNWDAACKSPRLISSSGNNSNSRTPRSIESSLGAIASPEVRPHPKSLRIIVGPVGSNIAIHMDMAVKAYAEKIADPRIARIGVFSEEVGTSTYSFESVDALVNRQDIYRDSPLLVQVAGITSQAQLKICLSVAEAGNPVFISMFDTGQAVDWIQDLNTERLFTLEVFELSGSTGFPQRAIVPSRWTSLSPFDWYSMDLRIVPSEHERRDVVRALRKAEIVAPKLSGPGSATIIAGPCGSWKTSAMHQLVGEIINASGKLTVVHFGLVEQPYPSHINVVMHRYIADGLYGFMPYGKSAVIIVIAELRSDYDHRFLNTVVERGFHVITTLSGRVAALQHNRFQLLSMGLPGLSLFNFINSERDENGIVTFEKIPSDLLDQKETALVSNGN